MLSDGGATWERGEATLLLVFFQVNIEAPCGGDDDALARRRAAAAACARVADLACGCKVMRLACLAT